MNDDPQPLPQLDALKNAAEQFVAAFKDGNAGEMLEYFAEIFTEALAAKP